MGSCEVGRNIIYTHGFPVDNCWEVMTRVVIYYILMVSCG